MKLAAMKFFDKLLKLAFFVLKRKPLASEMPKKILVIKLSAMGDAVCLMPAVRQLSTAFGGAKIDWFTSRRTVPAFFSALPFLGKRYVLPTSPFNLIVFFAKNWVALSQYDLIIDFDQYYRISELLSFFGKNNAGFCTPLKGGKFCIVRRYDAEKNEKLLFSDLVSDVVKTYGCQDAKFSADLPELLNGFVPGKSLCNFVAACQRAGRPTLIFYPGSSPNAIYRRWPIERYIELIDRFSSSCEIVVAGGPDEAQFKNALAIANYDAFDYIGSWSLHEWLWIFKNVQGVFVGNDAGLLHLAESQRMPIVGIFGPNIYSKWGSVNSTSSGVEVNLNCRPCIKSYLGQVPRVCGREDVKCLSDISVDMVANVILDKLSVDRFSR